MQGGLALRRELYLHVSLGIFCVPLTVDFGGYFRGFYFAAAAPKDVGVEEVDPGGYQVPVDCGLVFEDEIFISAMNDSHNVDITEVRASFAPVAVS